MYISSNFAVFLILFVLLLLFIILVAIGAIFFILYKNNKITKDGFYSSQDTVAEPSQETADSFIQQDSISAAPVENIDKVTNQHENTDIILSDNKTPVEVLSQQEAVEQIEYDDVDDENEIEDENILVVIAAAVAYLGMSNGKKYSIRSIRRVKRSPLVRSAWANSGIMQNTRPF